MGKLRNNRAKKSLSPRQITDRSNHLNRNKYGNLDINIKDIQESDTPAKHPQQGPTKDNQVYTSKTDRQKKEL